MTNATTGTEFHSVQEAIEALEMRMGNMGLSDVAIHIGKRGKKSLTQLGGCKILASSLGSSERVLEVNPLLEVYLLIQKARRPDTKNEPRVLYRDESALGPCSFLYGVEGNSPDLLIEIGKDVVEPMSYLIRAVS